MLAGDERAVDEFLETDRLKGDAVILAGRLEGGGKLPARGEAESHLDARFLRARTFGIDEAGVPVDDADRGVAVAQMSAGEDGGLVTNVIEVRPYFAHPRRDVAVDTEDFDLIAFPADGLAVSGLDAKAADILQRAFRGVAARDPFGIPEAQRSWATGN